MKKIMILLSLQIMISWLLVVLMASGYILLIRAYVPRKLLDDLNGLTSGTLNVQPNLNLNLNRPPHLPPKHLVLLLDLKVLLCKKVCVYLSANSRNPMATS